LITHDRDHNQSTIFDNNLGLKLHWQTRGQIQSAGPLGRIVEGFYCKRPIQCMASSVILTPNPLTAQRVCAGGGHMLGGWRGGGGSIIRKTHTLLCTLYIIYVSTLWVESMAPFRKPIEYTVIYNSRHLSKAHWVVRKLGTYSICLPKLGSKTVESMAHGPYQVWLVVCPLLVCPLS
jgi:hypothetical protein